MAGWPATLEILIVDLLAFAASYLKELGNRPTRSWDCYPLDYFDEALMGLCDR
jgi:hypothetical protein